MIISLTKVRPNYFKSKYKILYMSHNSLVYSLCIHCDFRYFLRSLHEIKTFNTHMKEFRELNDY